MSIGRVTVLEFQSPEDVDAAEAYYKKIRDQAFPTLELVLNIRTGPTSLMSIATYPSYDAAARNLPARQAFQKEVRARVTDTFYHEGDITYFFQNAVPVVEKERQP